MEKFCVKGYLKRSGKRVLSILLCVCMIGTMIPITARAETEGTSMPSNGEVTCTCANLCTEDKVNSDCPVCGAEEADLSKCTGKVQSENNENQLNTGESEEAKNETELTITGWEWIDEEECINPETGILALPFANEETPAFFDDVVALLPTQIQTTVVNEEDIEAEAASETITLGDWSCEEYPKEGAYSGSYTFATALPEGYVLSEEAKALNVLVELGGAQMYETGVAETVGAFTVTGGTSGTDYTYADGVLTIMSDTPITIKNTNPNTPTSDRIEVARDVKADITLAGVNINVSASSGTAAFKIADDSTGNVTITLADNSVNTLKSGSNCAGLQKNGGEDTGTLIIQGGTNGTGKLTAIGGSGGYGAAGIGGGYGGSGSKIKISGGTVTANGKGEGAGIGGGSCGSGSNITISGGTVTATGFEGAAIGGGDQGTGSNITISGGTVTATGVGGAGIGGGNSYSITISGGTVTATGYNGAGIGGGSRGYGSNITISGGNVTATSEYGAGIGGGNGGEGSNITISGGIVTATGSDNGAGIGGGGGGSGSNITISGGTVTATGSNGGAGIGGGYNGPGSNIAISGGSVKAVAGSNAIGGGAGHSAVTPTSDGTKPVYLLTIANPDSKEVLIDGVSYTPVNHKSVDGNDGNLYAYLTGEPHLVKVGEKTCFYVFNSDSKTFSVAPLIIYPTDGGMLTYGMDYTYENNVLTIKSGTAVTIANTDPSTPTTDRIEVEGNYAYITLAGVNIDVSDMSDTAAFKNNSYLGITLAEGSVNKLISGSNCAGLQSNKLRIMGEGELIATGGDGGAGIGGGYDGSVSDITITGGTVTATGSGGGAGIGGGYNGKGSQIYISGGTVTATGSGGGAGIGGGQYYSSSLITINGGTVTATGGSNGGAGIGGGNNGKGSSIKINGGTVTATGSGGGAGIGGGNNGSGSDISIKGGTVTATGGSNGGAGIGGGNFRSGSNIHIEGGTVTATGSGGGAGIGGGDGGVGYDGSGSDITITGGTVTATSGSNGGAGIGGGDDSTGSAITMDGDAVLYTSSINGEHTFSKGVVYDAVTVSDDAGSYTLTGGVGTVYGNPNVSGFTKPTGSKLGTNLEDTYCIITVPDVDYTGEEALPTATVTVNKTALSKTLLQGIDYTVSVSSEDKTNAGAKTATITAEAGSGNVGETTKAFNVKPVDLSADKIKMTLSGIPEAGYVYDSAAKEPVPVVTLRQADDSEYTLIKDTDYTVSYSNNTDAYELLLGDEGYDAGKAPTVKITAKDGGNFSGSRSMNFKIYPADMPGFTITTYNGSYDGAGHEVVSIIPADGFTAYAVYYSTDNKATWSTTVPTITDAGTLDFYVKVTKPNYKDCISEKRTAKVTKATPYIATAPTAAAITYGDTLGDSTLNGGTVQYSGSDTTTVSGSFAWKDSRVKPSVSDSGTTAYRVVFNPSDTVNYNTAETDITLTVNKADNAPNMPSSTMNVANSFTKVSDVTLPTGWVWRDADKNTALAVDTPVTATAVYNGADKGNYENETVSVTITRSECEHAHTEVRNAKESTCKETGYTGDTYCTDCGALLSTGTTIPLADHQGGTATCTKKAVCTVCGQGYGELDANNHVHTEIRGTVAATCTAGGYTGDTYCTDCGVKIKTGTATPALGHNYTSNVTTEPTTEKEGVRTYTCERCGDSYTESIPKLPEETHEHSYSGSVTKEPTCTDTGVRTYTCSCGDSYTETIPALGHHYVSSVTKEPTTSSEGVMTYTCDRCGHSYTRAIAKLQDTNNNNPGENQPGAENKPDTGKPYIKDENGKEGWDVIKDEVDKTKDGDTVTVEMNGTSVVPGDVLDDIKGKDVTIVFDMGGGITWSVNGKSITADRVGDIDFTVKVDTNTIPVDIINNVTGERYSKQISLSYDGEFGFTAVLSINMEASNAGLYANLFYYNEKIGEMEFICADEIAADGTAELTFTHASDYAIVIDKEPMEGSVQVDRPASESQDTETESTQTGAEVSNDAWNPWWIIVIGIMVIVIGLGVFLVAKKNKSDDE